MERGGTAAGSSARETLKYPCMKGNSWGGKGTGDSESNLTPSQKKLEGKRISKLGGGGSRAGENSSRPNDARTSEK